MKSIKSLIICALVCSMIFLTTSCVPPNKPKADTNILSSGDTLSTNAEITPMSILAALSEGDYEYFASHVEYYTKEILMGKSIKNNADNEFMDKIFSNLSFVVISENENITTIEVTNKDLTTLKQDFAEAVLNTNISDADNPLIAYIDSENTFRTVTLDIKTETVDGEVKVVVDKSFIDAVLGGLSTEYLK